MHVNLCLCRREGHSYFRDWHSKIYTYMPGIINCPKPNPICWRLRYGSACSRLSHSCWRRRTSAMERNPRLSEAWNSLKNNTTSRKAQYYQSHRVTSSRKPDLREARLHYRPVCQASPPHRRQPETRIPPGTQRQVKNHASYFKMPNDEPGSANTPKNDSSFPAGRDVSAPSPAPQQQGSAGLEAKTQESLRRLATLHENENVKVSRRNYGIQVRSCCSLCTVLLTSVCRQINKNMLRISWHSSALQWRSF